MDYKRIYICQVYSNIAAVKADSKEEAFQKLRPLIERWTEPDINEDIRSLDEFLTDALEEGSYEWKSQ